MKRILNVILAALIFTFLSSVSKGQTSEMVYDLGTDITVTTGADICADVVTINGTFSGDGTKCNSALPVELSSFSAIVKGDKVELNWQTATEVNNYGFEIQRSVVSGQRSVVSDQLLDWEKVGFVNGHGNSNSPKQYSFLDTSTPLSASKVFYRLKQIDTDGSFEHSKEIEVDLITPNEFSLSQNYPNPFNPSTTIKYVVSNASASLSTSGQYVTLKIFDVLGNEVATLVNEVKEPGVYNYQLSIDNYQLPSGVYFYELRIGNYIKVKKMIVLM